MVASEPKPEHSAHRFHSSPSRHCGFPRPGVLPALRPFVPCHTARPSDRSQFGFPWTKISVPPRSPRH